MMTKKPSSGISALSKLLIVIGVGLTMILAFYWDFGFQSLDIKSIYTVDVGLVSISIDPEYILGLIVAFSLYVGYTLYVDRELSRVIKRRLIETKTQMIVTYAFFIMLGIVGAWVTYSEFGRVYIWMYIFPHYVEVSKDSLALRINAIIALLLLLNWFIIFGLHLGINHRKPSKSK